MGSLPDPRTLDVWHEADVYGAARVAKVLAGAVGFGEDESEEIVLVARELGSNLVKHARGGTLRIAALEDAGRAGLRIESVDSGPGIPDPDQATTDGFSTAGGLGYGLGTVHRLMDEVDITSSDGPRRGTRVVCTRRVRVAARRTAPLPLDFGVATRAHPRSAVNGDAFVVKRWVDGALAAVIDGLGHGQFAFRAAQTARTYIERHFDQPLDRIIAGTGRVCRATRGVVLALVRFDRRADTFTFASVGNIEARLDGSSERISLIARRGVVGLNTPAPRVVEHEWRPGYVMVVHSDGIRPGWRWTDLPDVRRRPASRTAQALHRRMGWSDDDATVLVVKALASTD